MIDVVAGSVIRVTGTWGSGLQEIRRLLSWKHGQVLIRPLPQDLKHSYRIATDERVHIDADFLRSRSDTPTDPPGLLLFRKAVEDLPGIEGVIVWDDRVATWREDLFFPSTIPSIVSENNLAWLRSLIGFIFRNRMTFVRIQAGGRTLLLSRHFPPFAVVLLGAEEMNPALIRAYLQIVSQEKGNGNGKFG